MAATKVLLTGSTGFVGLNILTELIRQGFEAHLYVRASSNRRYIDEFDATIHEGELNDLEAMTSAMKGMDSVIHTAGDTSCFARDYANLHRVNVVGTRNIVDAVLNAGVKNLVYTSTTSALGGSNGHREVDDENTPLTGFRAKSPYGRTKVLAEREILRAHRNGIRALILNPAEVIGEHDHNFQWGRLVMAVSANQVPFLPPGGGSFCSAENVAKAHVSALTQGRSGQRYILAGDDRDYVSMLDIISKLLGRPFDKPTGSYRLLYLTEWLKEKVYPLLGKAWLVEPYRIRVFGGHFFYSSEKARRDLGYETAKLEDMLAQCIGWYRTKGILGA